MIASSGCKDSYIVITPVEGTKEELLPYEEAYKEAKKIGMRLEF